MIDIKVLDNCIGCGACSTLSPEVFEINRNFATINYDKISGHEESCIDAALFCPVGAIKLY
ncbi:ferredoxin [bacterium]|nr:ferredoxin [bacterium]